MTRRVVLLTPRTSHHVPPEPSLIPEASDSIIESMRPTTRRIATITVNPEGDGDFTTISAAVNAAVAIQHARATSEGRLTTDLTPDYWVDVIVQPGFYPESVGVSSFISIYCATGVLGDVVIGGMTGEGLGSLTTAGTFYLEKLRVLMPEDVGDSVYPKYPIHHASTGTSVWVECAFDADRHNGAGGTPFGADGGYAGTTILYKCIFDGGDSPNPRLNTHGPGLTDDPITYVYMDCTSDCVCVYQPLGSTVTDEVWLVDGVWPSVEMGSGVLLHKDPAGSYGTVESIETDSRIDWPVPVGCLSDYWRERYYPA